MPAKHGGGSELDSGSESIVPPNVCVNVYPNTLNTWLRLEFTQHSELSGYYNRVPEGPTEPAAFLQESGNNRLAISADLTMVTVPVGVIHGSSGAITYTGSEIQVHACENVHAISIVDGGMSNYTACFAPTSDLPCHVYTEEHTLDVAPGQKIVPPNLPETHGSLQIDPGECTANSIAETVREQCSHTSNRMRVPPHAWSYHPCTFQNRSTDVVARYRFKRVWRKHELVIYGPNEVHRHPDVSCWYLETQQMLGLPLVKVPSSLRAAGHVDFYAPSGIQGVEDDLYIFVHKTYAYLCNFDKTRFKVSDFTGSKFASKYDNITHIVFEAKPDNRKVFTFTAPAGTMSLQYTVNDDQGRNGIIKDVGEVKNCKWTGYITTLSQLKEL